MFTSENLGEVKKRRRDGDPGVESGRLRKVFPDKQNWKFNKGKLEDGGGTYKRIFKRSEGDDRGSQKELDVSFRQKTSKHKSFHKVLSVARLQKNKTNIKDGVID